jgi:hypothetical protein
MPSKSTPYLNGKDTVSQPGDEQEGARWPARMVAAAAEDRLNFRR